MPNDEEMGKGRGSGAGGVEVGKWKWKEWAEGYAHLYRYVYATPARVHVHHWYFDANTHEAALTGSWVFSASMSSTGDSEPFPSASTIVNQSLCEARQSAHVSRPHARMVAAARVDTEPTL